jgi:hypothetical protein
MIVSFTGPTFDFTGESKFNTLGDKLMASEFYENDLLYFSLNHGILKTKDNSLRLEDDSFMRNTTSMMMSSNAIASDQTSNINLSFGNQNNTLSNMSLYAGNDLSNTTLQQSGDEFSFNKGNKQLHTFDMTFTNLNSNDQSILLRFKEAFQLFLKKDEVILFLFWLLLFFVNLFLTFIK